MTTNQTTNPLDYNSLSLKELCARLAVRLLGWRWWRHNRDKLAALFPPENSGRTRWNFSTEWFTELPDEEWPENQYTDGSYHLYETECWQRGGDNELPTLFYRAQYPHPKSGYNAFTVIEEMRKKGFRVNLTVAHDNVWWCEFCCDEHPHQTVEDVALSSVGNLDPERAILTSALQTLDRIKTQAQI